MKSALALLALAGLAQGCMALNDLQTIHPEPGFSEVASPGTPLLDGAAPQPGGAGQLVQPVMGGAPTLAVPLGGNLYQPLSGGAPIVGIPTGL